MDYTATLRTNMGDIKIKLFAREVPLTVNNFVFLSRDGYYDGVKFHRLIKGFVIQSGDPTGTGTGTPGYLFKDEPITRDYEAGTLAMANAGPNTNGGQFFITHADMSGGKLPKNYTIFGKVADAPNMGVVNKIASVPVQATRSGELSSPTVDVHIDSVSIEELPAPPAALTAVPVPPTVTPTAILPISTPTPACVAAAGGWSAYSDDGTSITIIFTVKECKITSVVFIGNISGKWETISNEANEPINGSQFNLQYSFADQSRYNLSGTFTSDKSASVQMVFFKGFRLPQGVLLNDVTIKATANLGEQ